MQGNHTRRTIAALAISAAALCPLTACSVDTGSTTASTSTAVELTKDQSFITVLKTNDFPDLDPAEAISTAHTVCDTLDRGVSAKAIAGLMMEQFTPTDSGIFLGAAVGTYCPQYLDDFSNLGGSAA